VTELERLHRIEAAARRYRALELGLADAEEAYEDASTAMAANYANFGIEDNTRVDRRGRMADAAKAALAAGRVELDAALAVTAMGGDER
jgi:uncharacterized protein (DUF2164 family)